MLSKKHQRNSTVQEEGLTNEGRHHLLLLRKQAHDKRGIAESLHAQIIRARLTVYEVGVFSREISQLSKIRPPPSFRSHLSLSPMGVFSTDYGSTVQTRTGLGQVLCYFFVYMIRESLSKPCLPEASEVGTALYSGQLRWHQWCPYYRGSIVYINILIDTSWRCCVLFDLI